MPGITLRTAIDAAPSNPHLPFRCLAIACFLLWVTSSVTLRSQRNFSRTLRTKKRYPSSRFCDKPSHFAHTRSPRRTIQMILPSLRCLRALAFIFVAAFAPLLLLAEPAPATPPQFSVSFPKERSAQPLDGRLLLLLSNDPSAEPRMQISLAPRTQMIFGQDV